MLLKLTNATKDRVGQKLILNTDLLLSIFENKTEDGKDITVAFGMNGNNWEILETIDQIMEQVKNGN